MELLQWGISGVLVVAVVVLYVLLYRAYGHLKKVTSLLIDAKIFESVD